MVNWWPGLQCGKNKTRKQVMWFGFICSCLLKCERKKKKVLFFKDLVSLFSNSPQCSVLVVSLKLALEFN